MKQKLLGLKFWGSPLPDNDNIPLIITTQKEYMLSLQSH